MVRGVIPTPIDEETKDELDLSCTFCGPGTWATWEVITEDGLSFACDRHHAEMSQAKMIQFERMRGKADWEEIRGFKETSYLDDNQDFWGDT